METPEERTWRELQDNLRRIRKQHSPRTLHTGHTKLSGMNRGRRYEDHNHRKKHTPPVLPKLTHKGIVDLPRTPPTLRGSHYPVIPPLSADSDKSLNRYGVDIFDQNYDNSSSPLPNYSTHLPYNGTFQNNRHNRHHRHDPLIDGGVSRYSDLIYDVQYASQLRQRKDELRRIEREKHKYLIRLNRDHHSLRYRYSDTPDDFDIWRNKRWDDDVESTLVEPSRRFAWKDPRDDRRGLVVLDEQRKVIDMLTSLEDPSFTGTFMEYFLEDFLEHEMVLDVVCQVLVEQREKAQMSGRSFQLQELQTQQDKKARIKHESTWLELVYRPDIYEDVMNNMIQNTVDEESALVVQESISEMVSGYFYHKAVLEEGHVICNEVVQDLMPDVAIESAVESFEESLANDIIDREIRDCTESFLEEAFATGTLRLPLTKQEQHDQKGQVEKLAYHMLIDSLCLNHLLQTIANNGKVWSENEYADNFLDDHIVDALLKQYMMIVDRRNITACCIPLKRLHEKVSTQIALDVILEELTGHLDEDMENLLEYEVAVDHAN